MKKFHRDNQRSDRKGGKKFGVKRPQWKGAPGNRGDRPNMHDATCGSCGNQCQVPFLPNGRRPVLCRDCFRKDEGGAPQRFSRPSFGDKRPFKKFGDRPQTGNNAAIEARLIAIEAKLDALLKTRSRHSDLDL